MRVSATTLSLTLAILLIGLIGLIWLGLGTPHGRRTLICPIYDQSLRRIEGALGPSSKEQLARILPTAPVTGKPRAGWTFAPIGDYVIPLPPSTITGNWRYEELYEQNDPDSLALHFLSSKQHLIMLRPYPEAGRPALNSLLSELLYQRPLTVTEFNRLVYERDLSQPCDPERSFFDTLGDALLLSTKGSSLNSGSFDGVRLALPSSLTFIHRSGEDAAITTVFRFKAHWLQLNYMVPWNPKLTADLIAQLPLVLGKERLPLTKPIPFENQYELDEKAHALGF